MAVTVRRATLADLTNLVGEADRYSLNFLPHEAVEGLLRRPNVVIFLALDGTNVLGWGLCIEEQDAQGRYILFDRLTHRRRLEAGTDADGAPLLGPKAVEVYGRIIKAAMVFYARRKPAAGGPVTRSTYTVPDKMWVRIQQLYADSRFAINVTIRSAVFDGVNWHVEVGFGA